jgi:hypothetical protein
MAPVSRRLMERKPVIRVRKICFLGLKNPRKLSSLEL